MIFVYGTSHQNLVVGSLESSEHNILNGVQTSILCIDLILLISLKIGELSDWETKTRKVLTCIRFIQHKSFLGPYLFSWTLFWCNDHNIEISRFQCIYQKNYKFMYMFKSIHKVSEYFFCNFIMI